MKIIFILFSLSLFSRQSFAVVCEKYKAPKIYTDTKSKVDKKINEFSNKKAIAQRADETLAKLIAAKSPIISSWMNKRSLNSKSEDEIVREWRSYFARNFILTKYPHGDVNIDKAIDSLMMDINKTFANKNFKDRLKSLFEKSKKQSLKTIMSFPIGDEQKKKISLRVQSIQLYWMKDFKTSKFSSLPMDYLDWGIAYDPVANEINIGINSLSYPNDETYLAVFSHEIGHSFDSCRWGAYFEGAWPFESIGECLRKDESVGAKKRDDSKMDLLVKANKELALSLKANLTCNKLGYPSSGLQADQLPESFADWFSTETMASFDVLKTSQLRADLCDEKELSEGSSYPSNDLRLRAIYYTHPKLKDKFSNTKQSTFKYCGWDLTKK
jgi:hypothetical protein